MATADDLRRKYFTEKGEKTLFTRLKTLIDLYENGIIYPFEQKMLGFVALSIRSKDGHLNMINELRQILGLKEVFIKKEDEHGRVTTIEVC